MDHELHCHAWDGGVLDELCCTCRQLEVVVMRGVPGSGKSWLSTKMFTDHAVSSADSFFYKNGVYTWDRTKLGEAHSYSLRTFVEALQSGRSVVVDNTNVTAIEMAPYVALAKMFGAKLRIIRVECDPNIAAQRNTHGVTLDTILRMDRGLRTNQLPSFWNVKEEVISNQQQTPF